MFSGFFTKKPKGQTNERKTTRTGMVASNLKNKRLKTRKEMRKMRSKLPEDYQRISEGTFAEMSEITPEVYLTGIFGLTRENFDEKQINNVINVSYEAPDIEIKGISYMRILADDDPEEDLSPFFDSGADFIDRAAKKGGRTVVHCVAGVSRSTAIVLAYLIKYKNMTLKKAFKLVFERRDCVKPIIGFMRQLIFYEKKIRGNNSCQIVKHKREGVTVFVPNFWITEYPQIVNLEIEAEKQKIHGLTNSSNIVSTLSTTASTDSKTD